MKGMLINPQMLAAMKEQLPQQRKLAMESIDIASERLKMGSWIAEYLEDAGYSSWYEHPRIYKTMIMNAFPPLDPLDGKDMLENNEKVNLEQFLCNWLTIIDSNVKLDKMRLKGEKAAHDANIAVTFAS